METGDIERVKVDDVSISSDSGDCRGFNSLKKEVLWSMLVGPFNSFGVRESTPWDPFVFIFALEDLVLLEYKKGYCEIKLITEEFRQ